MKLFRCPKGCHAANRDMRCPHCGEWLKYDGEMEPQLAHDKILQEQRDRAKASGLSDWKRKTDSRTRAVKEHYKREEAKYYHKLNGH